MSRVTRAVVVAGALVLSACADDMNPADPGVEVAASDAVMSARGRSVEYEMDAAAVADIEARLTEYVQQRAAAIMAEREDAGAALPGGARVAQLGFSWSGSLDGESVGTEVFFLDRGNKQLPVQWIPGDPRRGGRTDVGYAFVEFLPFLYETSFVTAAETFTAISDAMETWATQSCSGGLTIPLGTFEEWLFFESDVLHEGFAALPPGVLGVTSPFVFVDALGVPTDMDNDGALDYAFAIITYSSLFPWGIDTNVFPFIDVETVALHEMGHGLGQAHFGTAFRSLSNGKIHFAPRSVMNAGYSGLQQSLAGTDRGGHCSLFGSWPNN